MAEYPNWFDVTAKANFEQFLLPDAGKPDFHALQLGAFTGDASVWMLENVLTGERSTLTDVDTWKGAPNEPVQEQMDFEDVYQTYLSKVERFKNAVSYQDTTQNFLSKYAYHVSFDFIYVDAHHTAASAFLDCELSWPLLKFGGLLAVDDYTWQHPDGVEIHAPKLGVSMFIDRHRGEFDLLALNTQAWLRKK